MTGTSSSFGRAFLRGLLRPGLGSLLGAVAVAALLLGAAATFATPRNLARFARAHDVANVDDPTFVFTVECLMLRETPPEPGAVVILGASDVLEAIWSPETLAAAIEAAGGGRREIRDLSFRGMWIWDVVAAMDSLPDGFDGTVVIGVGPPRMANGAERYRLGRQYRRWGFASPLLDEEARRAGVEPPERSGLWFADNLLFLRGRWRPLLGLITGTARPRKAHHYLRRAPWTGEPGEADAARHEEVLAAYPREVEANLGRLRRAMEAVRRRGNARFVLLEAPRNPDFARRFHPEGLLDAHRERMERFAAETGAHRLDLDDAARLAPEDFCDPCHLRSEAASRRYTAILGERLAALLAGG